MRPGRARRRRRVLDVEGVGLLHLGERGVSRRPRSARRSRTGDLDVARPRRSAAGSSSTGASCRGAGRGRGLGYPDGEPRGPRPRCSCPGEGVYAGRALHRRRHLPRRDQRRHEPHVRRTSRCTSEAFLLDFDGDLRGRADRGRVLGPAPRRGAVRSAERARRADRARTSNAPGPSSRATQRPDRERPARPADGPALVHRRVRRRRPPQGFVGIARAVWPGPRTHPTSTASPLARIPARRSTVPTSTPTPSPSRRGPGHPRRGRHEPRPERTSPPFGPTGYELRVVGDARPVPARRPHDRELRVRGVDARDEGPREVVQLPGRPRCAPGDADRWRRRGEPRQQPRLRLRSRRPARHAKEPAANGIAPVGAGKDPARPRTSRRCSSVKGWTIAVVGFDKVVDPFPEAVAAPGHPGTADGHDENRMVAAVRAAKRDADLVIVAIHWGVELDTQPRPDDVPAGPAPGGRGRRRDLRRPRPPAPARGDATGPPDLLQPGQLRLAELLGRRLHDGGRGGPVTPQGKTRPAPARLHPAARPPGPLVG